MESDGAMETGVENEDTQFTEIDEMEVISTDPATTEPPAEDVEIEDDDEDLDDDMLEELLNAPDSEEDNEEIGADENAEASEPGKSADGVDGADLQSDKLVRLPLSRIKQIIRLDNEVDRVNRDAVFLIAKAAELFVQSFSKEIYKVTARTKKKTIQLKDLNTCVEEVMCMQFLEGCFLEQL